MGIVLVYMAHNGICIMESFFFSVKIVCIIMCVNFVFKLFLFEKRTSHCVSSSVRSNAWHPGGLWLQIDRNLSDHNSCAGFWMLYEDSSESWHYWQMMKELILCFVLLKRVSFAVSAVLYVCCVWHAFVCGLHECLNVPQVFHRSLFTPLFGVWSVL